tara:strand:+ start:1234 stop:1488 length:255 start_codon:yes stop_codon:yes gene_type:complete
MKNYAELELQYMRLKKESSKLTNQEIKEERQNGNPIKIAKLKKQIVDIIKEMREIEKIILNDEEIPDRIYRFGRWYIAEQEVRK